MGTDLTQRSTDGNLDASREPTLSAARLAVAARRARTEVGAKAPLLLSEPIAIVGMGCRFPGGAGTPADTPEKYWKLLAEGRSGIRELPEERWAEARKTLPPHLLLGGYLDGVDEFDAEFFGIAPREAHSIDPQQRLLLEVCWEALADGGMAPGSLGGSETGVFIAVYNNDYARLQMQDGAAIDSHTGVGAAHSVAAGRISFLLNLRGPCLAVDTACSSSLVAAHLACQSLRQRECNTAIVGGCSLKLLADEVKAFAQWGMLSGDGQAKTFDARADGFAAGEGCGVIVLKRLSDAVAQGDRIRGVIRGSAVNHDGRSSVLTAPNGPAQEAVIRAALKDGQLAAGDVSYVEAHGTGTSLGDPIEVEALDAVYGGASGAVAGPEVVLGAVKTNFGHLEAAAGLAGVIKAVLALENQAIPRNLNFAALNPQILLGPKSRLRLATEAKPWPRAAASLGQPRFAGLSSFGLGGTNAHLILEEAPLLPRSTEPAGWEYCLPVSSHAAEGLVQGLRDYARLLREPAADLGLIAKAAARGRDHAAFRVAVTGATGAEVAEKLEARQAGRLAAGLLPGNADEEFGKLGFVFSGQGSLWPGMLATLTEQFPVAEKTIAECETLIEAEGGWSLRAVAADGAQLEDTAKAQPVLFAMQMALVRVLESWGVAPEAVCGHSVGEVAAAVAAGAMSLEEGVRLVLRRGARMGARVARQAPGRMLSVETSEAAARGLVAADGEIEIAAVNGPLSVVFAGPEAALTGLAARLAGENVGTRWLDVKYAFHSAGMAEAARGLEADLRAEFALSRRGAVPMVSTVSGEVWRAGDGDAAYWARGIRQPVLFSAAVGKLLEMGCRTVVEIGPHPVLLRSVTACAAETPVPEELATVAVMRRGQPARATMMAAAGLLYERGCELDWKRVYPGPPSHVALPPYRWNRQRYWLAEAPARAGTGMAGVADSELPVREISSAFIEGRLFESQLGTGELRWLADHCFEGVPVLPFTAWLEMARRAGASAGAGGELREFAVHRRLEMRADPVAVQTLVAPGGEVKLSARLSTGADSGWESVASGFWGGSAAAAGAVPNLDSFRARAIERIAPEEIYAGLEAKGLTYGPAFRLLRGVVAGPGFALAEVSGPASLVSGLHPALLDACLQAVPAAFGPEMRGVAVLPVSVRSYRIWKAANEVFALAEVSGAGDHAEIDVTLLDAAGLLVAEIRGLRVRRPAVASESAAMWRMVWGPLADSAAETAAQVGGSPVVLRGGLPEVTRDLLDLVARERELPGTVRRVCVVTRGACAVFAGERVDAEQAALWGLGRSFRAEYPAIAVQLIDLPLGGAGIGEDDLLGGWIAGADDHSLEMALRQGRWLRSRLEAYRPAEVKGESALAVGTPGLLETLHEEPANVLPLGPGEVQIAVRAHGLNFRDVLTALGNYAGVAGAMGAECSGVVVRAGVDAGLPMGSEVVAFARDSMRSVVNVPVTDVVLKPRAMTFAEAATVPVAFLTAHYGFSRLAKVQPGQTVLVHSAAGGLGQAAVQLARQAGATVLATAGSEEKRAFLRGQGIAEVFDSRSAAFAEEVLAATGGRGVDVVLNALSGDKIAAGFKALAAGGAFLEVGKRDVWSDERAKEVRPDVRYFAFDLGDVSEREPGLIQAMLGEIFAGFATRELGLMPAEVFAIGEAERAFRHMAAGRHVGKLVLTRELRGVDAGAWERALRDGTVLITGGTGALGLATARWLLGQGARSLVLMSRSGGADVARDLELEFGARVRVEAGDVADRGQLAGVLGRIRGDLAAPLRIVFHAAGVTEDHLLSDQTSESFARGMRTKVEGARLLEELTAEDDLAATVYFSSAAALLGSAGQASYATANAYLDGLAEERTARGLPTLSVNWGAWAEGGMVGQLSVASSARLVRQGIKPMRPERALAGLGKAIGAALRSGAARLAIADMDWAAFGGQYPAGSAAREFFDEFLPVASEKQPAGGGAKASVLAPLDSGRDEISAIVAAAKSERASRMEAFVRSAARRVLGLSAGRPMPADTPMQEFGLDSLMALELRNVLAQAMGRPLSATLLFDYPSIRGLGAFLLELAVPVEVVRAVHAEPVVDVSLAEMSDAEAEELLLAELNRNGSGL